MAQILLSEGHESGRGGGLGCPLCCETLQVPNGSIQSASGTLALVSITEGEQHSL